MKNVSRKLIGILFLIIALVPLTSGVAGADAPPEYTFTTIDPPGAKDGYAFDISPSGEIVGNYQSSTDNRWHGFVLRGGEFTTIDYPGVAFIFIRPSGIGPSGDIVGGYFAADYIYHGFLLTKNGEWSTVDYPGQRQTFVARILPDGTLVGANFTVADKQTMRGVIMSRHGNVELDVPCICPYGATPDGKVLVGYHKESDSDPFRAFVMDNGVFTSFRFPGSLTSMAWDVSPDGRTIVGTYSYDGKIGHGFLAERRGTSVADWEFTTIDVPGALHTSLHGCNLAGDLVGRYVDAARKPHLFLASRTGGK